MPESPDGGEPEVTVEVMTPDDVMDGRTPSGAVLVLDLDPYYMGGVIAEKLAREGHRISLATSAPVVSPWTAYTDEQHRIMVRLLECGIDVVTAHHLVAIDERGAELACVYGGTSRNLACDTLIVVGARAPVDELERALAGRPDDVQAAGITEIRSIGDLHAPGAIVHAVASGHRYARELDANDTVVRVEPGVGTYAISGNWRPGDRS